VKNADSKNSDVISNQTNQMEQDWSNENAHLQKMLEKLKNLLKNWEKFEKLVTKITETHSSLFNDFDSIDGRRVESQAQLLTDKQKITVIKEN
jgi:archaellum component FlaC